MPHAARPFSFRHDLELQEAFVFRGERVGDLALGTERDVVGFVETAQVPGLVPVGGAAFYSQHHQDAPPGVHLHHDVRDGVGDPDVALGIEPQAVPQPGISARTSRVSSGTS